MVSQSGWCVWVGLAGGLVGQAEAAGDFLREAVVKQGSERTVALRAIRPHGFDAFERYYAVGCAEFRHDESSDLSVCAGEFLHAVAGAAWGYDRPAGHP